MLPMVETSNVRHIAGSQLHRQLLNVDLVMHLYLCMFCTNYAQYRALPLHFLASLLATSPNQSGAAQL